jgi:hypothetical protein
MRRTAAFAVLAAATALTWSAWTAGAGEDVTLEQVPGPVRATIEREVGGVDVKTRIKEIEREKKDGKRAYEVEFVRDGKTWEMHVAEDGSVVKMKKD